MSGYLSVCHGYDIKESKAWLQFDVLEKLKDPNFLIRLFDSTICAYQGPDGKSDDILLPYIEMAGSPQEATILGRSVWYVYADFLGRDSKDVSDKTVSAIASTLCFVYHALNNVIVH